MHDEAEIRGHRRTYIGALPGSIIQALRKAGTRNPRDDAGRDGQARRAASTAIPSSALLEVLDPEQNSTFRDNYLGVPFDLSAGAVHRAPPTCWTPSPGPLRDRMEVIELPGYTEEEKLEIAKRYLVQRQLEANGLTAEQVEITDEAICGRSSRDYTREAGVRNLEREIGGVLPPCRDADRGGHDRAHRSIGADDVARDPRRAGASRARSAMRTSVPGVATGLAWTPVGGDILFIEATRMPGNGRLILTGQLGDVMKESAQAALSLVKSRAGELGVDPAAFEKIDIHVHVPAGAIPKDGPSAGVAMFMALASLLTGRTVRSDLAMTGEISLRGLVLPVGGIKEKVLAAQRAGITTVMLPARNRRDYEEIPESARASAELRLAGAGGRRDRGGVELTYANSSSGALRPNRKGTTSEGRPSAPRWR